MRAQLWAPETNAYVQHCTTVHSTVAAIMLLDLARNWFACNYPYKVAPLSSTGHSPWDTSRHRSPPPPSVEHWDATAAWSRNVAFQPIWALVRCSHNRRHSGEQRFSWTLNLGGRTEGQWETPIPGGNSGLLKLIVVCRQS